MKLKALLTLPLLLLAAMPARANHLDTSVGNTFSFTTNTSDPSIFMLHMNPDAPELYKLPIDQCPRTERWYNDVYTNKELVARLYVGCAVNAPLTQAPQPKPTYCGTNPYC